MRLLYFAYGSNMNHEQMSERCPSSKFLKRVCLKGYKFVYDGYSKKRHGAVANIVESKDDIVWGALWEISEEDLEKLDYCEGYPTYYQRKEFEVIDDEGNKYRAIAYYREGRPEGKPSKEYQDVVVNGARQCGLPEEYIEKSLVVLKG